MSKRYNKCHFCGGKVTEQRVVVDYRWGEELLAIIENVPASVCDTCGRYTHPGLVAPATPNPFRFLRRSPFPDIRSRVA